MQSMRTPSFWKEDRLISRLLLPAATLYAAAGRRRWASAVPFDAGAPVICVGNFVAGGAGKTPVALMIGSHLASGGARVCYVSRGYGGSLRGPVRVDPGLHTAAQVGDEPLLLAERLPTWIGVDRAASARAALEAGMEAIVMDDGFQNPTLAKTLSLLVIDGRYGFGNGRVLPAGPLREPLERALKRASCVLLLGEDRHDAHRLIPEGIPVFRGNIRPLEEASAFAGKQVVAFCGIAHPHKFHQTLQEIGCEVASLVSWPDHHRFTLTQINALKRMAASHGAQLVTTAKDMKRLPLPWREGIGVISVKAEPDDPQAFFGFIARKTGLPC
jgi:tetraacyldisaccharide 4'-kinase